MRSKISCAKWAIVFVLFGTIEVQAAEPADLLQKARQALVSRHYDQAAGLTRKANALWAKSGTTSHEYADSLVLCSLALLGEDRYHGTKASDAEIFTTWEKESADLLVQALSMDGIDSYVKALALELQSLQPRHKDEAEGLRKRANEIHANLVAGILPDRPGTGVNPGGGALVAPTLISQVEPSYVMQAIIMKISGEVFLSVVIEPDGQASSAKLVSPLGWGLDEQAARCVKEWKFNPGTINGAQVRVQAQMHVKFKLI